MTCIQAVPLMTSMTVRRVMLGAHAACCMLHPCRSWLPQQHTRLEQKTPNTASDSEHRSNSLAYKVGSLVAQNLERYRLVVQAILLDDLNCFYNGGARGFVFMEKVTSQQHKINF